MTKEKIATVEELKDKFTNSQYFYVTDYSTLTVEQINNFRRKCFEKGVEIKVLKNTLVRKALEQVNDTAYTDLYDALKGPTAIMFSEKSNVPAKLIKEFRKDHEKPVLKAAYIDSDIFLGDEQVESLSNLKSKDELIGDVLLLLESPMKNVLGSLQSGSNTLSSLLKALEQRGDAA
mgnify:CR=1 FL=1